MPSSLGVVMTLLQFTELTLLVFCWSVNSVEGDGQEMATAFEVVSNEHRNTIAAHGETTR